MWYGLSICRWQLRVVLIVYIKMAAACGIDCLYEDGSWSCRGELSFDCRLRSLSCVQCLEGLNARVFT